MAESFLSKLLFTILKIICWAVNRLTQLFEIFSGLTKVSYNGERIFLFDVFLNNTAINNIYWGMALIGIVLCFAFAISSVVRKMFDASGRVQMSIGQIITETLKSIILILSMNLILTVTLTTTDVIMRQVNYLFSNAEGLNVAESITYTDEQCAAMGRALGTIANYGMNPSFNSRYNLNDCFNTIRPDLIYLEEQGVFDYHYPQDSNSWQSVLQEVAASADLRYELKADVYYENVAKSLQHALDVMRTDSSFRPLEKFKKENTTLLQIPLDRIIFLSGSLNAANNGYYNVNPNFTDALRYPYYSGEKSLYDTDTVDSIDVISSDFSISYARFDYLVSIVLGIAILVNTFVILLSLVARMFNILLLYVIAPPVLAVRPLDGGGKSKQWAIAFLIQALGVFGSIIVMRLLLIFVPVIFDSNLVLIADNSALNYFAKAVMLFAAYAVAKKASGLITGILSDSAAMQSAHVGDMKDTAMHAIGTAKASASNFMRRAGAAAGFVAAPALNYFGRPFQAWRNLGAAPDKKNGSGDGGGGALPGTNRSGDRKQGNKGGGDQTSLPKPPGQRARSRSMPNLSKRASVGDLPQSAKQKGPVDKEGDDLVNRPRNGSMPNPSKRASVGDLPQSAKQKGPANKGEGGNLPQPEIEIQKGPPKKGEGNDLPQPGNQRDSFNKEGDGLVNRPRGGSMPNLSHRGEDGDLPQSAKQQAPDNVEKKGPFDQADFGNIPESEREVDRQGDDVLPERLSFKEEGDLGDVSQSEPRQRSNSAPTNIGSSGASQPGPRQRANSAPTGSGSSGASQPEPRQRSNSAPTGGSSDTSHYETRPFFEGRSSGSTTSGYHSSEYASAADRQERRAPERQESPHPRDYPGQKNSFPNDGDPNQ